VKQTSTHQRRCPDCDAHNDPGAVKCWLCSRPLSAQDDLVVAELVHEGRSSVSETLFAVLTVATAGLSLLLILGALNTDPGIAAMVALCVAPAFVATAVRMLGRRARGKPFSWQTTFLTFVVSVTAVIGLICVLIVALVIALIVICFRMLGGM